MNHFNGMPVIVSDNALEKTKERLFPESKNRVRRIHKKLVMHPRFYAELKAEIDRRNNQHGVGQ
jgi:hypothetical protein